VVRTGAGIRTNGTGSCSVSLQTTGKRWRFFPSLP
jgi:hypothetical protein